MTKTQLALIVGTLLLLGALFAPVGIRDLVGGFGFSIIFLAVHIHEQRTSDARLRAVMEEAQAVNARARALLGK